MFEEDESVGVNKCWWDMFFFKSMFIQANEETWPSRPIRCDMWIVERMRYPTNRPADRPTDTASYRGALSQLKICGLPETK